MRRASILAFFLISSIFVTLDTALASDTAFIRRTAGSKTVIVFVHGIFGNARETWTSPNGAFFPDLLAADRQFDGTDIYAYEYPSSFLKGPFSIDEISENMRLFFDEDGVSSYENIVFVAHSMGGLVARAYLLKNRNVAKKTRLIYFFATPTEGSQIASIASLVSKNPQLAKMQPMRSADYLGDLQRQWLSANFDIPSYCAYETQPTYGQNIVTQASASNLCNRRLDPIDADHISIVKPSNNRASSFLALKSAFKETIAANLADPLPGIIRKSGRDVTQDELSRLVGYDEAAPFLGLIYIDIVNRDERFQNLDMSRTFDAARANLRRPNAPEEIVDSRLQQCKADAQKLQCLLMLKFYSKPVETATLAIQVGPILVSETSVGNDVFAWQGKKLAGRESYVAVSQLKIVIDKIDWLVLTKAEILPGLKEMSILRIGVTNLTPRARAIANLGISATKDSASGYNCNQGDVRTTVTLDWQKILARDPHSATVGLGGVDVPAKISYNFRGVCSAYSVIAMVPIGETVEADTSKDIYIRIKEWPAPSGKAGASQNSGIPNRLADWPSIRVGLTADQGTQILPRMIDAKD